MFRRKGEGAPGLEGRAPLLVVVEAQAGRSARLLEGRRRNRGGEGIGEVRPLPCDLIPASVRIALPGTVLFPVEAVIALPEAGDGKAAELLTS